tara:strand:+ start:72 stop:449 length:378 start_codon:yes stop_codon:yes gene_type:complete
MNKSNTWLIGVFAVVLICVCLFAYLNAQKKPSLLLSKPSIEDLKHKALDKKRANAEFAGKRDYKDYEKFGSMIFCNASFNSRIESANYAKQMELYISGKEADLSEWDTAIENYENARSKCRDFNP